MAFGGRDRDGRSIGQLVSSIMEDFSTLIRSEIELAKAELRESAKRAGAGAGLVAGAAFFAFFAFVFLLVAAAYGLVAAGLPVWAGFLIVALILLLLAGILGAIGKTQFDKVKGPERAMAQKDATRKVIASVPQRFKDATEKSAAATSTRVSGAVAPIVTPAATGPIPEPGSADGTTTPTDR